MVNGTALQQVTVQVDFTLNSCVENNCTRRFIIHDYQTSIINMTIARTLSNYRRVTQFDTRNVDNPTVRENASVRINFRGQGTGFYLGIQDIGSCLIINRVLVFYYVCPAVTDNLIIRPETIAPVVGDSTPIEVVGQCVENATPENVTGPRFTCSQRGVWSAIIGAVCVCNQGFQPSSDGRLCEGRLSAVF